VRLGHYTDPADIATLVAVAASTSTNIKSVGGGPSAAQMVGSGAPTYEFDAGDSLDVTLDGVGPVTVDFAAVAATITGAGFAIASLTGDTFQLKVDGGETQTVTFTAGATTLALAIAEMNAQLSGVSVDDNGGQVRFTSDKEGSASIIELIVGGGGGDPLGELGHAAGVTASAGPNDVADINAVTFAEFETVLENDIAGLLVTQDGSGNIVLTSGSTGASSDITIASIAVPIAAATGLANGTETGSASATEHCLTIAGAHAGEWGNDYSAVIVHNAFFNSLGSGSDLSAAITATDTVISLVHGAGLQAGVVIRITDGSNTEYKEIQSIDKVVVGSAIRHDVTLTSAITNGYLVAATAVDSLEFDVQVYKLGTLIEVWSQLSMLDTADNYIETIINDEATGSLIIAATDEDAVIGEGADQPAEGTYALASGTDESTGLVVADIVGNAVARTGVHALDDIENVTLLATPSYYDAAMVQELLTYCELRQDMFYAIGPQAGLSRAAIFTYRQNTGGFNSKYGALYWPRIKVSDPLGAGSSPKLTIDPVGHVLGVYARVDNIAPPDGGVHSSPAGEGDFGKLRGALELELVPDENDQNVLNPVGVNCLRRFQGQGIVIFGARTLSADPDWKYISVRRLFNFIEKSILQSTRSKVFRNNDYRLWSTLTTDITDFLEDQWKNGAMPGNSAAEAFFVNIGAPLTTQADIDAGRLIGQIGIAPQKPAEFLIFRFSQFDGGTSLTES